jgi:hypothetical protein
MFMARAKQDEHYARAQKRAIARMKKGWDLHFTPGPRGTSRCFVDTNILVYAQDRTAGIKPDVSRNLVQQLWETRLGVLSNRVLQEFCATLLRKIPRPVDGDAVDAAVQDYLR